MSEHEAKKRNCAGCHDNYYNSGGNSTSGECWALSAARLKWRWRTGTWALPTEPHAFEERKVYQCFREKGYHYSDSIPDFAVDPIRRPKVARAPQPKGGKA